MKVYVVTQGEYSDYHICAVVLDREKAEFLKGKFTDKWSTAEIEEYDTDEYNEIYQYNHYYNCCDVNGVVIVKECTCDDLIHALRYYNSVYNVAGKLVTKVAANSEKEAVKKAADRFAKYKAERMGL